MRFVDVQGCPVPRKLAVVLVPLLKESRAHLESAYRGSDPNAQAILRKHGKHSQQWIYDHQGTPEQPNPANRPGTSTHELFNDGVAYPHLRAGARLQWWQCGLDVRDSDVDRFIKTARRHGLQVAITYPSSIREHHHLNFRKPPLWHRIRALRGSV